MALADLNAALQSGFGQVGVRYQTNANIGSVELGLIRRASDRSLLEAAAMGKPIITTDRPGCRTVIEDGNAVKVVWYSGVDEEGAARIVREHAIELMATRTRQYAKRQDTWARRWPGIVFVDANASGTWWRM